MSTRRTTQAIAVAGCLLSLLILTALRPGPATAKTPEPSPAASFSEDVDSGPSFEDQVMELANQARWNNGQLPPLKRNALLDAASETHSANMAARDFFAHCDVDTKQSPWDRMIDAGYDWNAAAENIAAGYSAPADVMNGWMNSAGHRANILSTGLRELGIGYVYQSGDQNNVRGDENGDCTADAFGKGPYFHYWTQDFGRINTVYPIVINREAYQSGTRSVNLYVYGAGWAQDMRLRNEDGSWTAWQPYNADVPWTLSAGSGAKTVQVELRNGSTVRTASDTIILVEPFTATDFAYLPVVVR